MSAFQSGVTYYELKEDGVYVHTTKMVNGISLGDLVYKITYRQFNTLLQQEAGEIEQVGSWNVMDTFMKKRGDSVHYILPAGTFEVMVSRGKLRVKQKIGNKNFPFFQSGMSSSRYYRADYGSEYVVEWLVTGSLHGTYKNELIQVVSVQKLLSGNVLNGSAQFQDVPYLKEKLARDFKKRMVQGNTIDARRECWMAGAEPILRYVQAEDLQNERFITEFERSSRDRNAINWTGV
ncbi:hypothetical protein FT641_20195 [Bacillus paranthracis]|uniref:hypothetical protein n=1 Tax=Bacillus paranthracis TaxID=2026186 RepID=UPI00187A284B|nr:hypothetical protein [Bacillus paranthracis]MBE7114616.1 hypothetical protein [Bacillus paranthracis]MBE7155017.1 hypothetical protein [Bacillus paranthracis]